jgi:hypothetical protein
METKKKLGRPRASGWAPVINVRLSVDFETHPDVHTYLASHDGGLEKLLIGLVSEHLRMTGHPASTAAGQAEILQSILSFPPAVIAALTGPKSRSHSARQAQPVAAAAAPLPQHPVAAAIAPMAVEPVVVEPTPAPTTLPALIQAPVTALAPEANAYIAPAPVVNPTAWHEDAAPSASPQPAAGFEKPAFLSGLKK